ncbi:MAG TPA: beta-ketoacyl synthase N-terminal-like domain-containing protein [Gemmatimonadales bacterium]
MTRIGVFGWGVVAPKSPDIQAFERNLESAETWLTPFNGFGPDTFLVGSPVFDFEVYRPWVESRFPPSRFHQLKTKMGTPTLYAIGSYIQALAQNPGLEDELRRLDTKTHVYIGTGVGDIPTISDASIALYHAQRRWDRFWAEPCRNKAFKAWVAAGRPPDGVPADPATVGIDERDQIESRWWSYWAGRSPELAEYLTELRAIEGENVEGLDIERAKLSMLKHKQRRTRQLQEQWGAPEPPWKAVTANVIWNIHNTPASQISMLGHYHGLSYAPIGACATFGVTLKLGMDAIRSGAATAVIIGAVEPVPHPVIVGSMYSARVLSADADVSKPLHGLRGTHVAGGAVLWIVADMDHMTAKGFKPIGMEPLSVGVSNDAHHIITPSKEGPLIAIRDALRDAGVSVDELSSWDLHATATPGDYLEVENLRDVVPASVLVTARKGTFGHGMGAGGGWELTAQYLGYMRGKLYPTPLAESQLHPAIAGVHRLFVFDKACRVKPGPAGKLSMGVGGVNACVISRPLEDQ